MSERLASAPEAIESGVVYDPAEDPGAPPVACFAGLFVASSGTIFTAFQAGPEKNAANSTLRLCRSRDGGRTWRTVPFPFATDFRGIPGSLSNGELAEPVPGKLLLIATWLDRRDPKRPIFDPATGGLLHARILKAVSHDDGSTWTAWSEIELPTVSDSVHSSGPILQWKDGSVAFLFETHKRFDGQGSVEDSEGSWLMISRDGGERFEGPFLCARDPQKRRFYWDARMCAGDAPGALSAFFWTHDHALKSDLRVHRLRGRLHAGRFVLETLEDTGIPGQIAAPVRGENGDLGLFVVDRSYPGSIRRWISSDDGAHWREGAPLYVNADKTRTHGMSAIEIDKIWENIGRWSFGHPAARRLADGTMLVVYYAGDSARMGIRWARLPAS